MAASSPRVNASRRPWGATRRNTLNIAVRITHAEHSFDTTTHNLSAGGMQADMAETLSVGDPLTIDLPHIGSVGGRVVWTRGARFGVAFTEVVDIARIFSTKATATKRSARRPVAPSPLGPLVTR